MSHESRGRASTCPCRLFRVRRWTVHAHLSQVRVSAVLVVGQHRHLHHERAHARVRVLGKRHGAPTLRFRHLHADHFAQVPRGVAGPHRHVQRRVALVATEVRVQRHALHRHATCELRRHRVRLCAVALPVRVRAAVARAAHAVPRLGRRRAPHRQDAQLASAARMQAARRARQRFDADVRHARPPARGLDGTPPPCMAAPPATRNVHLQTCANGGMDAAGDAYEERHREDGREEESATVGRRRARSTVLVCFCCDEGIDERRRGCGDGRLGRGWILAHGDTTRHDIHGHNKLVVSRPCGRRCNASSLVKGTRACLWIASGSAHVTKQGVGCPRVQETMSFHKARRRPPAFPLCLPLEMRRREEALLANAFRALGQHEK